MTLHSLPLFHRIAGSPVIVVGEGEAADAKRRLVERAGGRCVDEGNAHARIAFVALQEPTETVARLRARGVLVNTVDRPDLCDFTVPSLLERDPVLIAVGTGGVSAGLAKALRLRLEQILPAGLGKLAGALSATRERLRAVFPDPGERRLALDAALAAGGVLDPLRDYANGSVEEWLEGATTDTGRLVEITLSSDDPDDLTLRQARWLGSADLVLHDAAIAPAILNRARADAVRQVLGSHEGAADHPGVVLVIRRG